MRYNNYFFYYKGVAVQQYKFQYDTTHILVRWWDTLIYIQRQTEREFLKNDTLMYFIH